MENMPRRVDQISSMFWTEYYGEDIEQNISCFQSQKKMYYWISKLKTNSNGDFCQKIHFPWLGVCKTLNHFPWLA